MMNLEWTVEIPQPAKKIRCVLAVYDGGAEARDPKESDLPHILRLIPAEVIEAEGWTQAAKLSGTIPKNCGSWCKSWERCGKPEHKRCDCFVVAESNGTEGPTYNAGRSEGHADVCAELRAILDPGDEHHWNKDGALNEVRRLKKAEKDACKGVPFDSGLRDQIARQKAHIENLQATLTKRNDRIKQLERDAAKDRDKNRLDRDAAQNERDVAVERANAAESLCKRQHAQLAEATGIEYVWDYGCEPGPWDECIKEILSLKKNFEQAIERASDQVNEIARLRAFVTAFDRNRSAFFGPHTEEVLQARAAIDKDTDNERQP